MDVWISARSKIRRIKCDEQKPNCKKCFSTGRTCDGYAPVAKPDDASWPCGTGIAAARPRLPPPQALTRHRARGQPSRSLAPDFDGDMIERQYINHWLPIAHGVVKIHDRESSRFWLDAVPEFGIRHQGIRHAIVALSAAHEMVERHGLGRDLSRPPGKLECFVIRQYNKAIRLVREHVDDEALASHRRFGIIVMACILFFYTEILLNQWPTAMMHILTGLRLMTNPPDDVNDIVANCERWRPFCVDIPPRAMYVTRLLCRWETTAGFLASHKRPSMTISVWRPTQRQTCAVPDAVASLEHLCEVVDKFYCEALAFLWLCAHNQDEDHPWDAATFRIQHKILQQRGHLIAELLERCRETYGILPKLDAAQAFLTYQSRWLHLRSATLCLDAVTLPLGPAYPFPADFRATKYARFEEILALARMIKIVLQRSLRASSGTGSAPDPAPNAAPAPNSGVDFGVVSALYLAATRCSDAEMTWDLFAAIRDWPWQENLWDGPALRTRLIQGAVIETALDPSETAKQLDPSSLVAQKPLEFKKAPERQRETSLVG
ncbi:hypothetical protein ESCO_003181 [Escovopsis weberi]|uniref:Zn(2)-C6 fungal-type domain-containing protein n=1 Tax=Escovopsis weberi TaxID=150374 RepID=A0A0N0RT64_ESCWE|nr:hypothetical protein ESCO_003181 [Escovopsis weberi]